MRLGVLREVTSAWGSRFAIMVFGYEKAHEPVKAHGLGLVCGRLGRRFTGPCRRGFFRYWEKRNLGLGTSTTVSETFWGQS